MEHEDVKRFVSALAKRGIAEASRVRMRLARRKGGNTPLIEVMLDMYSDTRVLSYYPSTDEIYPAKSYGALLSVAELDDYEDTAAIRRILAAYPQIETKCGNSLTIGTKKEKDMADVLYTWKDENDKEVFGTKIGTTKNGHWVMEPKGGGDVVSLSSKTVTEVVPYTVKAAGGGHYACNEGDVKVGDIIALGTDGSGIRFRPIVAVDTKCRDAAPLDAFVLSGHHVKFEE